MQSLVIREAQAGDLHDLLELYTHLHNNPFPEITPELERLWAGIMADLNHHILLGIDGDTLVSSCVIVVIPNLTHHQRPYALIENVVTHPDFRGRGFASRLLDAAKDIAISAKCYKIMLMTGSKEEKTLRFYRNAGYNAHDKTAFIQWLS